MKSSEGLKLPPGRTTEIPSRCGPDLPIVPVEVRSQALGSTIRYFFHRNLPKALVVTIAGGAVLVNPAFAQSPTMEELEEIVVTGLRGSLTASMDIKRDAIGVVDAISAEDIGKFPDANLSESLQRITGISIDRRNGEGALVTARGFGAQFNMVTLNGRNMPAADAFAGGNPGDGGVGGAGRAFNFANLASESISALEVYKTSRADIATGGIGSTINIVTAKPFDNDGWVANVGVKAVNDTTNRTGDDFTPEIAGIFSYANDDKTWGIGLAASYQKRDSGASMATVNDWNVRTWTPGAQHSSISPTAVIDSEPAAGSLYSIPNDIRYHFADRQRERINGQLTMQFAPSDALTLSLDYTYAETELIEDRGDQTLWMNANRYRYIQFDTGEAVATPLILEEDEGTGKDFGFEQQHREQTNELHSVGFNADWQVTDAFSLSFDIHDSSAESVPSDPITGGGETLMSFAARVPSTCLPAPNETSCTNRFLQRFYFNHGLPIAQRVHFVDPTASAPASGGDPDFAFTPDHLGSQYLRVNYQEQTTDITQARLDGALEFDGGRFQFGVEGRAMESRQLASNAQMTLGDWGVANPGEMPVDLLVPFSLTDEFDDFNTTGAPANGWKGDANTLAQWAVDAYGTWRDPLNTTGVLGYNPGFSDDHLIEEDTAAAYIQVGLQGELGSMPANVLLGVRYERTEIEATSQQIVPSGLLWQSNNDFSVIRGTEFTPFTRSEDYDHVLPNLDFDIELIDNVKARLSYGKTIARAQYADLRSAVSNFAQNGSSLNGQFPRAQASNPALVPLESDNVDLSIEWYFDDSSYLSAALWEKRVSNFIGLEVQEETLFDIRDVTAGERALAAQAALQDRGFEVTDTSLFTMMGLHETLGVAAGTAAYDNSEAQALAMESAVDFEPNATDPLAVFRVQRPVNNREAKIHGWEFAGQHFFGNTGFGIAANYTIVRGDVSFDNAGDPGVNQFALLGLSDSANLVLMYENHGLTVRLAYNWRDDFLSNANRGGSRNPEYTEEYEQVDLSIGYQLTDNLSVAFEGLNLTEQDVRRHARSRNQMWFVEDLGARYSLGARYKF